MAYKPKFIEDRLLNKFNFSKAKTRSSDHKWYELKLDGLPVIATKVSHSKKDIGDVIEGQIAKQLRVRRQFFKGMMDCKNNRDAYTEIVKKDPYPPFDISF